MKEQWKDIPEYEGIYQVSNLGRIKSIKRTTTKGGTLKLHMNKHNGYIYACLCKNNKPRTVRVHVVEMNAFNPIRDNSMQVNHIDGDKTNNMLKNLEWCTQSENMKHAYRTGLEKKKGIKIINLDTKEIFNTATDAAKSVGNGKGELVARVCRGERSHYKNRHYAFYDDYINGTIPKYTGKNTKKASIALWR